MDPETIRSRWGPAHFHVVPADRLASLPLRPADAELLRDIGLPTTPAEALTLNLRFETVRIQHQPQSARSLVDAPIERGPHFPRTGVPEIDSWADLTAFTMLGEVPNDFGPGPYFQTRFVVVDGLRGNVWWVYPKLSDGRSSCFLVASGLAAWLGSLLAYREFREAWARILDEWSDARIACEDDRYQAEVHAIHSEFLRCLEEADPAAFKGGFWEEHAWNEAILLEMA
jgi:hypothetical protein